jgi:hypothetical protein
VKLVMQAPTTKKDNGAGVYDGRTAHLLSAPAGSAFVMAGEACCDGGDAMSSG